MSTRIRRIALVTPPYHSGVVETAGRWPNLAFVYIAGHLREAGFEPVYYDAMTADHDLETITAELRRLAPDVVLTTAYTASYPKAIELLRLAKAALPGVITGIGGVHAHFMYEEVLTKDGDAVDYVLRGEGEITAPELMRCLDAGGDPSDVAGIAFVRDGVVHATPARPFVHDLDTLIPAWDLVDFTLYRFFPMPDTRLSIMSTSRGCDQACSFCSQQKFWERSWRARTRVGRHRAGAAARPLRRGRGHVLRRDPDTRPRTLGALPRPADRARGRHLHPHGDASRRRAPRCGHPVEVSQGRHPPHLCRGGAHRPGHPRSVQEEHGGRAGGRAIELINEHGMISETSIILGLPDDTPEIIESTFQLARHYDPDLCFFLTIAPWPYADNYPELKPYVISEDYEDYNLVAPVVKPKSMTKQELMDAVIDCYRRFYMGKLAKVPTMTPAKRAYFMVTMKLLMENSYLKQYMGGLGDMPEEVKRLMGKLK